MQAVAENSLQRHDTKAVQANKKKASFTGNKQNDVELIEDLDELDSTSIRQMLQTNKMITESKKVKTDIQIPAEIECENSIYLFNRQGRFRKICYYIQQHRYFDRFIMFLIAVSSLQLAFETYI